MINAGVDAQYPVVGTMEDGYGNNFRLIHVAGSVVASIHVHRLMDTLLHAVLLSRVHSIRDVLVVLPHVCEAGVDYCRSSSAAGRDQMHV